MKKIIFGLILVIGITSGLYFKDYIFSNGFLNIKGKKTVEMVKNDLTEKINPVINEYLQNSKLNNYPEKVTFIAIKNEKIMEMWFENGEEKKFVKSYKILAASGKSGPKLREGDKQVPEGLYRIIGLNPNSSYHLSMKLNYPNEFDKKYATKDNRKKLGGDIFIHGKAVSIGCLAMGDRVIEELFYLVSQVGINNISVIIAPYDFRKFQLNEESKNNIMISELYKNVKLELAKYKR